jgi:oxygen-independent coproporphyrinogen-3 oxidase
MDAHSMVRDGGACVRWANPDSLDAYLGGAAPEVDRVGLEQGFEEAVFLGLRLVEGVSLSALQREFGSGLVAEMMEGLAELREAGLVLMEDDRVRLTGRGRMVSNEVFERLLVVAV